MDPNETLAELMDALVMGEWDEAMDAVEVLQEWLDKGGFEPELQHIGWRNLMDGIRNALNELQ